jgi:hypothetical protein
MMMMMMMMILATTPVPAQPDVEVAASSSSKKEILGLNFFLVSDNGLLVVVGTVAMGWLACRLDQG